jgi:phosphoribosylformimino-5-aminoimidazole carboxamide ribonucleotide (ProFAR) isomerase
MRPLGRLQNVIDFLEAYGCDEVAIIRPVRDMDTMESFQKDINELLNLNCATPLSFGGGLRSVKHIDMLHNLPIERFMFSSSFIHKEADLLKYATDLYGRQAIQCVLPFIYKNDAISIFSSKLNQFIPIESIDIEFIQKHANEVILLDTKNEGLSDKFDKRVLEDIKIENAKLIIMGGIGKEDIRLGKNSAIASVIIDNKVLHGEYSIRGYKNA